MSSRRGLGLLVLASGFCLTTIASAQGEGAPPAPANPAPGAQPAPAPAAQPAPVAGDSAQQPPPASFGESASTSTEDEEPQGGLPPRVPWRGTYAAWINAATTTMLGLGRDNIGGDAEAYTMIWLFGLNYYVVDQDDWNVRVTATPGFFVELTNSDYTTTQHEPQAIDLPLTGSLGYTLFSDGFWSTGASFTGGLVFPTSPLSYDSGTVLNTTTRLGLSQGIPILGEDAPVLKAISLSGQLRWDHRFSRATTRVNDDLNRPRRTAAGGSQLDDQLGGGALAHDTLREVISLGFSEAAGSVPINLSFDFLFGQQFKYDFASADTPCVQIATGCVETGSSDNVASDQNAFYYGFGASIEVVPTPELGISLAYGSSGSSLGQNTLAEDGTHRSFFYAPDAELSATLTFYPDALYERIIGPPRQLAESESNRRAF